MIGRACKLSRPGRLRQTHHQSDVSGVGPCNGVSTYAARSGLRCTATGYSSMLSLLLRRQGLMSHADYCSIVSAHSYDGGRASPSSGLQMFTMISTVERRLMATGYGMLMKHASARSSRAVPDEALEGVMSFASHSSDYAWYGGYSNVCLTSSRKTEIWGCA